jgi:hypothetical protein
MSYYDSAEGLAISRIRVEQEFRTHGVLDCDIEDEFERFVEFYELPENQASFDAQLVLRWLGY